MKRVIYICGSGAGNDPAHLVADRIPTGPLIYIGTTEDVLDIPGERFTEIDLFRAAVESLEHLSFTCRISAAELASLSLQLEKLKPFIVPEVKPLFRKPFKSKIKPFKHAGNNFKRSGFQTSGKLARGRI